MARFINWGLQPAHSPGYGINHKYIAKELTGRNWKKKAIEWQIGRGSRSGRSAWQFVCQYANKK